MAEEVEIELSVDEKKAVKALNKLIKKTDDFEKETVKGFKNVDNSLKKSSTSFEVFQGAFAANIATAALGAITQSAQRLFNVFVTEGVRAAQKQEDAINRLNAQLKITGDFSDEAASDFQNYAQELQSVTRFGDEVILNQLALAKSFGATNDQAKQIVSAAADLSASLGIDLQSATRNVAKTLGGFAGELGETIPQLKALTQEQLQAGEGIQFLAERFRGAAQQDVKTFSGATDQLGNSFGDLQEAIGRFITQNPALINAVKSTTTFLTEAVNAVDRFRASLGDPQNTEEAQVQFEKLNTVINNLSQQREINIKAGIDVAVLDAQLSQLKERRQAIQGELAAFEAQSGIESKKQQQLRAQQQAQLDAEEKKKALEREQQFQVDLVELKNQFKIQQEEAAIAEKEIQLEQDGNELQRRQDLERQKLEIQFNAKEERAKLIKDEVKRRQELEKLSVKRTIESEKLRIKQKKEAAEQEKQIEQTRLQAAQGFLSAGISLAKRGSAAQKALQTTRAIISTYTAANQALASPPGPPFTIPLVAATIAQGLANVANIQRQSFATGGVVDGFSGATAGQDNRLVNARSGEMFLTGSQQRTLFDIANGQGGGVGDLKESIMAVANRPLVVQVDGREIANVVRDEMESGFRMSV